ncbi:glutathione-disulfide reductase [Rhodobacter capsulatus]|uniref:Glutathione reductase (NADPH) n=1 Tax=Rhodobacter capsulatus TaxID=1061 RepID=A0A1G7CKE6_RHOCA|nr:glutathione-disulfide reductase [Rhodobacter capsulatus]WER10710.1 glutathione-disulfide reductase [Rhodobacter capsulatus]SDE39779.1 glutathione reductase (NADPH) [Rhodobacter capsulatus]
MSFDFDLFVIGGGSGGVRAARIAAGHGARVALAEEDRMGGTCVIRGCVPKKLMVFASDMPAAVAEARAYGWDASLGGFDWGAFKGKLHAELDRLEKIYRAGQQNAGVTVLDCRATVKGPHEVQLADGRVISAKHILIAVGGRPFVPAFEGAEHVLTSNDLFHLPELPKRLLIVGGGYIASEFACVFNGLGVAVAQWNRSPLLRSFDTECRDLIVTQMKARGIDVHENVIIDRVTKTATGVVAHCGDGRSQEFDAVVYATGRVPNTAGLGLETAGVKLGPNGAVIVDQWSQTNVPSIFAVGDVTDRINLTPVAIREGHAFADTIFGATPRATDHDLVASAVFTRPEFGSCGLSEEAARKAGPIEVYTSAFKPMRAAFAGAEDRVLMKLVVCKATRKVLGCHIVAPEAGEMIQMAAIAMKMGATKEQFDATCAVHPTMAEELVTMRAPTRHS